MSFSSEVKDELSGLPLGNACCRLAELAGIALAAGSMHLTGAGVQAEIATESHAIAQRVYGLIKSVYAVAPAIERHERHRLNRDFSYHVVLSNASAARRMLTEIGVLGGGDVNIAIKPELVRLSCCEGSFLRGFFLGCGSISDPEKDYDLEFVLEDDQLARSAAALMAGLDITARVSPRREKHVAYIREADHISAFLALAGAHSAMLRFESVRVEKGVRNSVNRMVNCDTANADRTVQASARQAENIRLIETRIGLPALPAGLRKAAESRLEYPDATLEKLAETMGVSKSGLYHRFNRIEEIADSLRNREEDKT